MAVAVSKPLVSERVLDTIFTLFLIYKLKVLLTSSRVMRKPPVDFRAEALHGEVQTTFTRGKVFSLGLVITDAHPEVSGKNKPYLGHYLLSAVM